MATVGVADLADAGMVAVVVVDLADAGMAFPADFAGVVTVGVAPLSDARVVTIGVTGLADAGVLGGGGGQPPGSVIILDPRTLGVVRRDSLPHGMWPWRSKYFNPTSPNNVMVVTEELRSNVRACLGCGPPLRREETVVV